MRTTIRIEDELYRTVKERAASSGRTVSAVLEDAVRLGLAANEPAQAPAPFELKPLGRGGVRPGIDLSSNASLQEALDEGSAGDALR